MRAIRAADLDIQNTEGDKKLLLYRYNIYIENEIFFMIIGIFCLQYIITFIATDTFYINLPTVAKYIYCLSFLYLVHCYFFYPDLHVLLSVFTLMHSIFQSMIIDSIYPILFH
jgi:hypothetical protein